MLVRRWKEEASLTAGRDVQQYINAMGISREVSQKKKITSRHMYDPAIPLLSIYPKNHKSAHHRGTSTSIVIHTVHNDQATGSV